MTIKFEWTNGEVSSSPCILLKGSCDSINQGVIQVVNNKNKVYPPCHYEINNQRFTAIVNLSEGDNDLEIEVYDAFINPLGFPEYRNNRVFDHGKLSLKHEVPKNVKPFFLTLMAASDSQGQYDMPRYRLNRGERPSFDMAIRKLKIMGRLFQAYTQEEMRRKGLSNRVFQFYEEEVHHQGIYGYNVDSPTPHKEIKIVVMRLPHPLSFFHNKDLAQQNSNARDGGWTWSHAIELTKKTPEIYQYREKYGTAVQVACMILDSWWDKKNNLITAHAALGGGTGDVKMAVFGSHGLHSYPNNFPQITPSFLDATHLSTDEVANDAGECGTSWECLNICSGAFLHEIGHALGCPHQVDGIMLRDYVRFNRAFMTREMECLRTNSLGKVIDRNGQWSEECHWNMQDLMRFLYHGSFSLPVDDFPKIMATTLEPDNAPNAISPMAYKTKNGADITSSPGFYTIELKTKGLARFSINFFPKCYGGQGNPHELTLDYNQLASEFKRSKPNDFMEDFEISCNSFYNDFNCGNFKAWLSKPNEIIEGDFGCGPIKGVKSEALGNNKNRMTVAFFDNESLLSVETFTHYALRGVSFHWSGSPQNFEGGPPKVPPRDYLRDKIENKIAGKLERIGINRHQSQGHVQSGKSLIGRLESNRSKFELKPNEFITRIYVRSGAWVDGIQFETNLRKSPFFGNEKGGSLHILQPPSGSKLLGMYGTVGDWLDSIGIIYSQV